MESFMVSGKFSFDYTNITSALCTSGPPPLTNNFKQFMTNSSESPGNNLAVKSSQPYVPCEAYPVYLNSGTPVIFEIAPDGVGITCSNDHEIIIPVQSGNYTLDEEYTP